VRSRCSWIRCLSGTAWIKQASTRLGHVEKATRLLIPLRTSTVIKKPATPLIRSRVSNSFRAGARRRVPRRFSCSQVFQNLVTSGTSVSSAEECFRHTGQPSRRTSFGETRLPLLALTGHYFLAGVFFLRGFASVGGSSPSSGWFHNR
jgi:hypothetical protein